MTYSEELITTLSDQWRIHDYKIKEWLEVAKPDINLLMRALNEFTHLDAMGLVGNLSPEPYLFEEKHKFLLKSVWYMDTEQVKLIDEDTYTAHLAQLTRFNDKNINTEAIVFIIYRYATTKKDIDFAKKLGYRSISHHSYAPAVQKAINLSRKLVEAADSVAA